MVGQAEQVHSYLIVLAVDSVLLDLSHATFFVVVFVVALACCPCYVQMEGSLALTLFLEHPFALIEAMNLSSL